MQGIGNCCLCGKPSNYGPRRSGVIAHDKCAIDAFVGLGASIAAFSRRARAHVLRRNIESSMKEWRLLWPFDTREAHDSMRQHLGLLVKSLIDLEKLAER